MGDSDGAIPALDGAETREIVMAPSTLPWRRICLLDIVWPDHLTERGTGFFVGPKTILTAGHCVFQHARGGWADKITATPGCDGDAHPYEVHPADDMHTVDGWIRGPSDDFDYGAIVLAEPVGSAVGWFSLAAYSDGDLAVKMQLAGYPVDVRQERTMWRSETAIYDPLSRRLKYLATTSAGESGAPVFVKDSGDGPVVAIHTDGRPGRHSAGARVTQDLIANVQLWNR